MDALGQIDRWPAAHVAVAVVDRSGIVASRGELGRAFALASVTKPLFAYAVLVAVEEGSLALDQPAGPPGSTIRHLLAHASGLPFEGSAPVRRPATGRVYSNTGFDVLGSELERATSMAAGDYLHEAVCAPLGLAATSLDGSPAHAARSTVADLARFARELLAPEVLDPATAALTRTVAFPGLAGVLPGFGHQETNDWGLGFEIRDHKSPHWTGTRNSPTTFGHFGRAGTFLWVDPAVGVALVVLTDEPFGGWSLKCWPTLSDGVLGEMGR